MAADGPATEKQKRIVYRRLILAALRPWEGKEGDFRIGLLLDRAGVKKSSDLLPELPADVVAAVADPAHPRRLPGPSGPLVLIKSTDVPTQGEGISVIELICAPEQAARSAALVHLERELNADGTYLSPFSQRLVKEYAEDIRSTERTRWIAAAMRLEQALEADFKFNLAAFRQGLTTRMSGGLETHWSRLLTPSPESLWSLHDDGYEGLKPQNAFEPIITALSQESASLSALLRAYDRRFGHLPLHPQRSLGGLVSRWLSGQEREELAAELTEWSQSSLYPLRFLQACEVCLTNPRAFPIEVLRGLLKQLFGVLADSPEDAQGQAALELLKLETDLVHHYFRFLELRGLGMDLDRTATIAWWAARSVSETIADEADEPAMLRAFVARLRERNLKPELEISELSWLLMHPRSGESSIRYATLFHKSPRILALLLSLRDHAARLPLDALGQDLIDGLTDLFTDHLLGSFPLRDAESIESIWPFDRPLLPVCKSWSQLIKDGESREKLDKVVVVAELAVDENNRSDLINHLPSLDTPSQLFFTHALHVASYAESDRADSLWDRILNQEWRRECFLQLNEASLQEMFDTMIELSRRVDDPKRTEIAHLLAERLESECPEETRQALLLDFTIIASAATGTVSAIRRFMRGEAQSSLAAEVERWQRGIRNILPSAPAVLAGRLRDILSSLRVP